MIGRLLLAGPRHSWVGALVALGVAAAFACLLPLSYSLTKQAMATAIRADVGNADILLFPGTLPLPATAELEELPGVAKVQPLQTWSGNMLVDGEVRPIELRAVSAGDWQALPSLERGTGPSRDGVVLSSQAAGQLQVEVGDTVRIEWSDYSVRTQLEIHTEVEITVVGIVASPASFLQGDSPVYLDTTTPGVAEKLARDAAEDNEWESYAVVLEPGTDAAQAEAAILESLAPPQDATDAALQDPSGTDAPISPVHVTPATATPVSAIIDEQFSHLGPLQLQVLLLGCAFVGLVWVTAVLVASSSLSLLVKRNTSELHLLRALGAHRRQVCRPLGWGALAIGLTAGLSGVLVGHFLSLFFNVFISDFFGVSPAQVGIISTPLAIALPFALALTAMPVAVFPALRHLRSLTHPDPPPRQRPGWRWLRLGLAATALLTGLALFRYVYASSVVVWNI